MVEGGEHGREGGPHPTPRGSPVQTLSRGGPQVVTRALQRPLPMCALRRSTRDHGSAPPRARRRHNGDARAGSCDPVRDRRHVRRHVWLLGRLVDRSCDLRARVAALCSRWNFSRGLAGLPCAWASGYVSSMSGSWLLRSGVGSRGGTSRLADCTLQCREACLTLTLRVLSRHCSDENRWKRRGKLLFGFCFCILSLVIRSDIK